MSFNGELGRMVDVVLLEFFRSIKSRRIFKNDTRDIKIILDKKNDSRDLKGFLGSIIIILWIKNDSRDIKMFDVRMLTLQMILSGLR